MAGKRAEISTASGTVSGENGRIDTEHPQQKRHQVGAPVVDDVGGFVDEKTIAEHSVPRQVGTQVSVGGEAERVR
jgi:hypothetical protein